LERYRRRKGFVPREVSNEEIRERCQIGLERGLERVEHYHERFGDTWTPSRLEYPRR